MSNFGANFSKNVWVFLIEILGFFFFLVSNRIFGSFSKLIFFRISWEFLVSNYFWFGFFFFGGGGVGGFFRTHPKLFLEFISISDFVCIYLIILEFK